MDYQHLIKLKEKFVSKNDVVILTDPIEKYNYFIKNYNVNYNTINNIQLKIIPFQFFYTICFLIQDKILNFFIIFVVIPGILLVGREYLNPRHVQFNLLICLYYFLIIIFCTAVLTIYLNAKRIFKKNSKTIVNPFKKMVFHPDICRNIINKHVELSIEGNN